jgi:RHS repeat-associated protein
MNVSRRALVVFGLLLLSMTYSDPSFAQSNCGVTEECTAVKIGPWRYLAGQGPWGQVINKWFDSAEDAEAAIYAKYMPSFGWCSLTIASRDVDSFPGYPWMSVGIDYSHSIKVNYDYVGKVGGVCQSTTSHFWFGYEKRRFVGCESGYSLKSPTSQYSAYCSRPLINAEPPKVYGCSAPPSAKKLCGNPGELGSGNKVQFERDYSGNGSFPLVFTRTYNSLVTTVSASVPTSKPLGAGWTATYFQNVWLSEWGTRSTAFVTRPDGRVIIFNSNGTQFLAQADETERLTRLFDGGGTPTGWSLVTGNDTTEFYNANGQLTSITSRNGETQTLSYDSGGLLSTVSDSHGHTLAFAFTNDSYRRLSTLTIPGGANYQFSNDASENLETVTAPDSTVRLYHYSASLLLGMTDESTNRFSTFTYSSGKLASTEHAGGVEKYVIAQGPMSFERTVTEPLGASRKYSFTGKLGANRNTGEEQPAAGGGTVASSKTLDANGNYSRIRDVNGNSTCYVYDLARNLEVVRVEGFAPSVASCPASLATYTPTAGTRERKITTAWHATYRLPTSINESNRVTSFTHDTSGNILTRTLTDTTVTPNLSRTWTYTYNSYGQVLTEDGPRTDVSDLTTYSYYTCTTGFECGQLFTIQNALGHLTTYNAYNAHGQPTQITDANGLITGLAYDARQRLTDRCTGATLPGCAGGELTHLEYFPTGLLKKVTNPDGSFIEYTYDAAHRLTEIRDGALNKVTYTLDNAGNRTAENTFDPSNALRRTHTRVFNTLNQLWKDVNAAGTAAVTTTFGYDNNGNQTTVNAPLSRNSTSLYDELNRLKQITDPASGITLFGYDANDNLTSVTDPRTLVTGYTYSGFGDLKTQTSPDTGLTTNTYDSGGNLDTSTDSRGAITDYGYDAANRVTSASFTLGGVTDQTLTYTYDTGTNQKGHLTAASDANHSLAWSYDPHGRITGFGQSTSGVTLSVGYGYNASGQRASTVLPSGAAITYGYNTNGQVTSLTLNGSTTILSAITYDPFGPITSWIWGNGTAANRGFDTDGKITQVDNANGASLKTYAYDDAFRITGISDAANSALSWTYGYDSLDRLNAASQSGISQGWTYDANGNRLTQTGTTPSTYTHSGTSNRVSTVAGSLSRTYAYDNAGNTLAYAGATFSYNNRGRMATASNGGVTATYTYNALGQRIKRTAAGITTLYAYDEAGHLAGEYTSTGTLIQETVWLGDTPVATLRPNGSGGVILYYVHADHLNTPRLITDTSNNLRWSWESDPFGTTTPNENPSSLGVFTHNLRFPGQQYDAVVGLHYNYFRDYDPAVGRYVESDPIGFWGGLNTYAYVSGNPLIFVDRKGQAGALAAPLAAPGLAAPAAGLAIAGGAGYGAGWVFNRSLNRILEHYTGTTLGGLIADCADNLDERRCKAVERGCKNGCSDVYADDRDKLPGTGSDYPSRWRLCVRNCMQAQGCYNF